MSPSGSRERTRAWVLGIQPLSEAVQRVVLEVDGGFAWSPGQHVAVYPEPKGEGGRYYSIASAPDRARPGVLELAVARREDAPDFDSRAEHWLSPAGGREAVPEGAESLSLIAMGTGVAPMRAVIQEQAGRVPLRLLAGARHRADQLFADEFEKLGERGQLEYLPTLTLGDASWTGLRGRVQAHLDRVVVPGAYYCVCGSKAMVEGVSRELGQRGVNDQRIFAEGY